ncbi:MAG: 7-cyano-7-deazaguanine synthase QueC [Candidatus Zipacnadales bacterium]
MRCISLLSGGLDSVVATTVASREGTVVLAITCDYGQRAAQCEITAAVAVSRILGIRHQVVDLEWLGEITSTALVDRNEALPTFASEELDDIKKTRSSSRAVWVPNRNGVLLNVAAAFAESLDCEIVVCGFNAEEGRAFPDNTAEYVAAVNRSLAHSTLRKVRVWSPTQELTKAEIVALGRRIGAPLQHVWSCYGPGPKACGKCESCLRLERAMRKVEGAKAE